jgi:integrase
MKAQYDVEHIIEKFDNALAKKVSDRTRKEYVFVAKQLLSGALTAITINSQSKLLQAKAVEKKLKTFGLIKPKDSFKLPEKLGKRSDPLVYIDEKYVAPVDFQRFLSILPSTEKGRQLHLACRLAYYGGLRLNEVVNLKPEHIKINGHVTLRFQGKGAKARKSQVPLEFARALTDFTGFSITDTYIRDMTKQYLAKAQIASSFHGFRHSFATNLAKSGVPVNVIQSLMGHSSLAVTGRYLHFADEECAQLTQIGY